MGKFPTFVAGMLVGAGMMYVALTYHIVQAHDGFHMVEKITAGIGESYVDVRDFGLSDWQNHQMLAAAIARAGKSHLLAESTTGVMRDAVNNTLESIRRSQPNP